MTGADRAQGPPAASRAGPRSWKELAAQLDAQLRRSPCEFGRYYRSAFLPHGMPCTLALFPCPPPYPRRSLPPSSSRRRGQRIGRRYAFETWINIMVLALSHKALRGFGFCPPRGRSGVVLNTEQTEMVSFVRGQVTSMGRLAGDPGGCGRTIGDAAAKLERMQAELDFLEVVPYGQVKRRRPSGAVTTQVEPGMAHEFDFPAALRNFQAAPFLSAASRRAFEDPDSMLLAPEHQRLAPAEKGSTSGAELLKLAERWDRAGRLFVAKQGETCPEDRAEVFGTLKRAADGDRPKCIRHIIHRKRRNLREAPLAG